MDSHVNENTALHIGLMANAFQAQQVQITSLQEQLAVAQEVLANLLLLSSLLTHFSSFLSLFLFLIGDQ